MFESESRLYNIFISHIGQNEEEYNTFTEKLAAAHDFEFKNYGILEKDKITGEELQEQIMPVGVVIILSGLYNKYKDIIKKQIDISNKLEKPIIVIRPYGMENVPPELEEAAADIIGWNAPCIVDAIVENYLEQF
ncbi:TIR domain-containing protein [Methanobacterium sp.]|uniref:TIR domain-containing protein n=1 Tax=Methanobacterium sp. TaxID=2164 RepID=UPI0031595F95